MGVSGGDLRGYNLFAYCFNNPVNMEDSSGNWPKWVKNSVKWVSKNIIRPVVKHYQKKLIKNQRTYSRGISGSLSPSGVIYSAQGGVSIDKDGNVSLQGSLSAGMTGGTPGWSVTIYKSQSNAPSVDKLNGDGIQIGGSAGLGLLLEGVPLAVGGDFNIIPDPKNNITYWGTTQNIGFGSSGGEFHVEWGRTATYKPANFNLFTVAEGVYSIIMEW